MEPSRLSRDAVLNEAGQVRVVVPIGPGVPMFVDPAVALAIQDGRLIWDPDALAWVEPGEDSAPTEDP